MPETNFVSIEELKFDEKGLIPAVVVDSESKKVLTVAYMNAESLKISMEKELTCFWSRSRQELWLKGETSGNYQHTSRGKRSSMPQPKTRPDSPVPSLPGPCDRSLKSEEP